MWEYARYIWGLDPSSGSRPACHKNLTFSAKMAGEHPADLAKAA